MRAFDDMLTSIDGVYAAAYGEIPWQEALLNVSDLLGYSAATLEFHDIARGTMRWIETARVDPAQAENYAQNYADINPRIGFSRGQSANVLFDHLFLSESDMDRDAFYADFLRPQNLRYFLSAEAATGDAAIRTVFSFQRSARLSGADCEGIELLERLHPHLKRAGAVYWRNLEVGHDPAGWDNMLASYGLTPAERDLASAIHLEERLKSYAARKGISINTVYTHYRNLKAKLDCSSQMELALRLGRLSGGLREPSR